MIEVGAKSKYTKFIFCSSVCFAVLVLAFLLFSLRETRQVDSLLRFLVEDAPERADSRRKFKYVFSPLELWVIAKYIGARKRRERVRDREAWTMDEQTKTQTQWESERSEELREKERNVACLKEKDYVVTIVLVATQVLGQICTALIP